MTLLASGLNGSGQFWIYYTHGVSLSENDVFFSLFLCITIVEKTKLAKNRKMILACTRSLPLSLSLLSRAITSVSSERDSNTRAIIVEHVETNCGIFLISEQAIVSLHLITLIH